MKVRICFIGRTDFETKPGGDTVQWHMYRRAAADAGLHCLSWFEDGPPPTADLYHAFNIDRPLELYPRLRAIAQQGRPFVLSTIHHPHPWVEQYRRIDPPGTVEAVLYRSFLGKTVERSEPIKEVVRLSSQGRLRRLADIWPTWIQRVRWILRRASKVLLLSRAEHGWLHRDFGVALDSTTVVPNWVEGISSDFGRAPEAFSGFAHPPVLVVGRIEVRKNVERIARLAERLRRELVFVGRANPNERRVVSFERMVRDAKCVRWVRGLPREQMAAAYRNAAFLLNASYVEVSPLVDIEALHFGCPVVTTQRALHHELLPPTVRAVDPYDDDSISDALSSLAPLPRQIAQVVSPVSAKEALLRCYMDALENI
jgi:glycosyltransferase involved in cell wall biosynthesis